jgi:hypothetical protein
MGRADRALLQVKAAVPAMTGQGGWLMSVFLGAGGADRGSGLST